MQKNTTVNRNTRISDTTERIGKFENDTNNDNVYVLEKKNKEDYEYLQKIEEIDKRYKNSYRNNTLTEAKDDLDYLERLK